VVKDRQTMVIGGLIRDNITSSTSKVPFLGDIPILGWLFKSKTTSVDKTNLMIFITPYIINNEEEAGDLARQKNDAMGRWREEYHMEKKSGDMLPMLKPLEKSGSEEPALKSGNTGTAVENERYPTPVAPAAGAVESAPTTTMSPAPVSSAVESVPTTTVSPMPAAGAMESVPTTTVSPAPGAVESAPTTTVSPIPGVGAVESAPTTTVSPTPPSNAVESIPTTSLSSPTEKAAAPAEVGR